MKKTKKVIPDESVFRERDKEAKFWEENFDKVLTDAKPVTVKFAKNLSKTLNIRLDSVTLNDVRKVAKAKGLGPTQLIRMWILEKLGNNHKNLAI